MTDTKQVAKKAVKLKDITKAGLPNVRANMTEEEFVKWAEKHWSGDLKAAYKKLQEKAK